MIDHDQTGPLGSIVVAQQSFRIQVVLQVSNDEHVETQTPKIDTDRCQPVPGDQQLLRHLTPGTRHRKALLQVR